MIKTDRISDGTTEMSRKNTSINPNQKKGMKLVKAIRTS